MGFLTSTIMMDIFIVLAVLCGLFYLYATWTFNHWKKRGLPSAPAFPLLGSLKESTMGRCILGDDYRLVYEQLKQYKCGGFYKYRTPTIMLCDPDLIKDVLVKNFSHFHDNDIDVTIDDDPILGRNPFCLKGDSWKIARSRMSAAFTPARMKTHYFPMMTQVGKSLEDFLLQKQSEGLEAKDLASLFATDVVASCVYGMQGESFTNPKAIFRDVTKGILTPDWLMNLKWMTVLLAPNFARLFKFKLFKDDLVGFFRGALDEAMHHRGTSKTARNDILQMLVQMKTQSNAGDGSPLKQKSTPMTDEDVLAAAITFFTDGLDTSATTLCFSLYNLAMNTDVQDRLRTDLDSALEQNGGEITHDVIQEVVYLDMIVSETLRLFCPIPFNSRLCSKPFTLPLPDGKELLIEEGTHIAIPVTGLHYDPQYFPDPERFDPERFSEEQKATRHPFSYLPFGAGPRMCPGSKFGINQVKIALATIVSRFEIRLSDRTQTPIVLQPGIFLSTAKGGIWIKFTKRTDK